MSARRLDWEGCHNVRDLGGLRTADGRELRRGAVVRGDAPDRLTAAGWDALRAHGIETIVDMRNEDERPGGPAPAGVTIVHIPLDGREHTDFWERVDERAPVRHPAVLPPAPGALSGAQRACDPRDRRRAAGRSALPLRRRP